MADLEVTYKGSKIVELSVTGNKTLKTAGKYCDDDIEIAYVKSGSELPIYEGPYSATPSGAIQILSTANKSMSSDVTINPIPSNYGLITYNGFELTVS